MTISVGHAPFVTSHISLKMWPSDKVKENCDTNLIRIANNNHATRELSQQLDYVQTVYTNETSQYTHVYQAAVIQNNAMNYYIVSLCETNQATPHNSRSLK